ncbi:hypothetical protein GC173_05970 [bacterium]|nr:hypothetical protein [bacterium]
MTAGQASRILGQTCSCTATSCPVVTPAPTPTPIPASTPTADLINQRLIEGEWATFGSRYPLNVNAARTTLTPSRALNPLIDTSAVSPFPNEYSPLTSQAVYEGALWNASQAADYADRIIFKTAGNFIAISNVASGPGLSRKFATVAEVTSQKYVFGADCRSIATRGQSIYDYNNHVGIAAAAFTAFHNPLSLESGASTNERRQMWVNTVSGAELNALACSNWIASESGGTLYGPIDGRFATYKEDEDWTRTPAAIRVMYGNQSTVWLDNKKTDYEIPGLMAAAGKPHSNRAGYADFVVGARNSVVALVEGSWVNANYVAAMQANVVILESPFFTQSSTRLCGDSERCQGSHIREAYGIDVPAFVDPCGVIATSIGIRVSETPNDIPDLLEALGGGEPVSNVVNFGIETEVETASSINRASIVANGSVVLGDGQKLGSGYDSDVVHVRDVLHLQPRSEPPTFDETIANPDRVGLIYFDLKENALRVSVGLHGGEGIGSEQRASIMWRTIKFEEEVDPAKDVVSGNSGTTFKDVATVQAGLVATREVAATGQSAFTATRVIPILNGEGVVVSKQKVVFAVMAEGFALDRCRIFTRRVSLSGPQAGMSFWKPVTGDALRLASGVAPGSGIVTIEADLGTDAGLPSEPVKGEMVEIVIVDPKSGSSSGTSVRITEVAD